MKALDKKIIVSFELVIIILLILNTKQVAMVSTSNATTSINPIADTYVDAEQPNVNFGNSTSLLVGHYVTNYIHDWDQQAYFTFNLKDVSCSSQAQFGVFTTSTTIITIGLYQVNNPFWLESNMTWGNRPLHNTTSIESTQDQNNSYTFFNVTNLVKIYQNGIIGFALLSVSNSSTNVYVTSRESLNQQKIPKITCSSAITTPVPKSTTGYSLLSLFLVVPIVSKFKHKNN